MAGAEKLVMILVLGAVAVMIGGIFVGLLWNETVNRTNTLGPYKNITMNGTTAIFFEMVPWMTAIGLVVSAVTLFVIRTGKLKRL